MKNVEGNLELISEIFSGVGKWHDLWVDREKEKVTTINFDEPIPSHQIIVINIINIASRPRQLLTCY